MVEVFLGIDIGTSSAKGVLVTADGEVVARATRPHETATPTPAGSSTTPRTCGGRTSSS